jgi:DNA-binding MarR family transcriptional regulator
MVKPNRESAGERAQRVAAAYVPRNTECAYNNLKVMTRVVSAIYDEELRPVGLRASQLALLWAIRAMEPVEFGRLGATTFTDQTTLSRTVALLKRAGLVSIRVGDDRRVRVISLTTKGLARFAVAMPLWERAQARADELLSLDELRSVARKVRKAARAAA